MKKIYTIIIALLFPVFIIAQETDAFNYQAVVRDASGQIMANKAVNFRISLLENGPDGKVVYSETHLAMTNSFGLVNLQVGNGLTSIGDFSRIDWSTNNYYLEVAADMEGGTAFNVLGTSKLLSVPFALYAKNAGNSFSGSYLDLKDRPENVSTFTNDAGYLTFKDLQEYNPEEHDGLYMTGVPAQVWSLFGNSKSDPDKDKLGTTDSTDLVMVTNDIERLRIKANGDIDMQNSLLVGADLTVNQSVYLNALGGSTHNYGPFTVENNSPTYLTGDLDVDGNADFNSAVNIDGPATLNNTLDVDGASSFHSTVEVDGNVDLNSDLNVDGSTTLNGLLDVDGPTTLNNTLDVDGATTLNDLLDVDGPTTLNNTLDVAGDADFQGAVTFAGDVQISNALNVDGPGTFTSTVEIDGTTTLHNTLAVDGNTDLNANLNVDGNTTLNGTFNSAGAATLQSSLTVSGSTTLNSVLNANGQVTIDASVGGGDGSYGAYPLRVQGSDQGIAIKVNGTRNTNKNFVTFWDANGRQGRIEGQTASELHNSFEYIWFQTQEALQTAFQVAMIAVDIIGVDDIDASIVEGVELVDIIANWATMSVNMDNKVGVAFESGSGDYAEWLQKANMSETFSYGDIVSVNGGKISKVIGSQGKYMVISLSPIVLGNMPPEGRQESYEKVAFMGQVPVKVRGEVAIGDYILTSGLNDGFGIAVHPEDMTLEQYPQIVGVAWSESKNKGNFTYINTAVGINANDLTAEISRQQKEMQEMKANMNNIMSYLQSKDPSFDATLYNVEEKAAPVAQTRAVQTSEDLTKAQVADRLLANLQANPEILQGIQAEARKLLDERGVDYNKYEQTRRMLTDQDYYLEVIRSTMQ